VSRVTRDCDFWTRQFHGTNAKRVREVHRRTSETHIFSSFQLIFIVERAQPFRVIVERAQPFRVGFLVGFQVGMQQEGQEDRHAATKPTTQNGVF
jgi:hypothetical protein